MGLLRRLGGLRRLFVFALFACAIIYICTFLLQPSNKHVTARPILEMADLRNNTPIFYPVDGKDATEMKCAKTLDSCKNGELAYFLSTSLHTSKPVMCVNGQNLIDTSLVTCQGIIVALFDTVVNKASDVKCFALTSAPDGATERALVAYLSGVPPASVVILATYVFSALKLNDETKLLLSTFGAFDLSHFNKPYSFLFVGQRGLTSSSAVQKVSGDKEGTISMNGCALFAVGNKSSLPNRLPVQPIGQLIQKSPIIYGNYLAECGNEVPCPNNSVSVKVYSGKSKDDHPKMCIDGRFVMDKGLNEAGRGLNIVVMNTTDKHIIRIGHFDTYQEDSSTLEIFLEQMIAGETIVVLSSDEASNRLSNMAKQMLYELGSGLVQNLKFRASWYMIGQKGLSGFTPFEQLNFASGNDWAPPVDNTLCVPSQLEGQKIRADPVTRIRNDKKRHFCMQYDGYEDFCDEAHVDDDLTPVPQYNKSWMGHDIYKVPIAVVAGLSHNSFRMTLQTLLKQQGIDPKMVTVFYDDNYPEGAALSALFAFQSVAVNASASYSLQMIKAIDLIWQQYPTATEAIIIEEELLVTADFLFYMGQLLATLRQDPTIACVSAWNDNGFRGTSTLPSLVYRIEWLPGLAFMISKKMYKSQLEKRMMQCCNRRAWLGWLNGKERSLWGAHCIVPDVSRVVRRHSDGLGVIQPHAEYIFHRERTFTTQSYVQLANVGSLPLLAYSKSLNDSISKSDPLNLQSSPCLVDTSAIQNTIPIQIPPAIKNQFLSVYLEQTDPDDHSLFASVAKCFGLFHSPGQPVRGLFMGVLRFSYDGKQMFLVGSSSPYFKLKPPSHYALRKK